MCLYFAFILKIISFTLMIIAALLIIPNLEKLRFPLMEKLIYKEYYQTLRGMNHATFMKMDGIRSFVLKETSQIQKIQCYSYFHLCGMREGKEGRWRERTDESRQGKKTNGKRERVSISNRGTNMRTYTRVYKCQNIANCFIYLEYTNKIKQVTVFYALQALSLSI